jgi:hypothetical protein
MEAIQCHFQRLSEVPVDALLHGFGVYVIWGGKARARPSYIGEGDIWNRLSSHRMVFERPLDGYLAVLGEDYSKSIKRNCQIVEAVLLEIAAETDRSPTGNNRGGNLSVVRDLFEDHGVLRVTFSGWDPFLEPGTGYPMPESRPVRVVSDGELFILQHKWRLRRLRKRIGL